MNSTEAAHGSAMDVHSAGHSGHSGQAFRQTTRTSDLWQHERVLTGWDQNYYQLSKGKFSGQMTEAWLGDLQLFEEHTSQAVFQSGVGRTGVVALGVFARLDGDARWRGNAIGLDHVTALSDHANLELSIPSNCTLLSVSVPLSMLPTCDQSSGEGNAAFAGTPCLVHSPALAAATRYRLNMALLTMAYQPRQLALSEARDQLVSELVGLVDEYLNLASAISGEPEPKKARHVVAMARNYIDANPDRPITVLDLCKRTFTSRRTLQYCFTQVIGMSPAAYLKVVRLNGLHRDLVNSQGAQTIGDIAARWGFWHLSQLSVDYRRLFGELPSETAKRGAARRGLQ